ncbi:hypothetical protein FEQ04_06689 [Burkholderia pseudomultivorans]|nr:hypothetical protein [Burkholderia pseudomultivorans]
MYCAALQSCHVDRSAFRTLGATVGPAGGVAAVPLAPRTVVVQFLFADAAAVDPRVSGGDEPHSMEPQPPRTAAAGRHAVPQRRVGTAADPPVDDGRAGTAAGAVARPRIGPPRPERIPDGGRGRDADASRNPLPELVYRARRAALAGRASAAARPATREARRRAVAGRRARRLRRGAQLAPPGLFAADLRRLRQRLHHAADARDARRPRLSRLDRRGVLGRGDPEARHPAGAVVEVQDLDHRREQPRAVVDVDAPAPAARLALRPAARSARPGADRARLRIPAAHQPDQQYARLARRGPVVLRAVEPLEPVEAHAAALRGAAGAVRGSVLPPRDGKLGADRHARARHARPHHAREPRVLPDDRLGRNRSRRQGRAVPVLAARRLPRNAAPARHDAARQGAELGLRAARAPQERHVVPCAPLRIAADRQLGPPDRLDVVDDRHHRAEARERRTRRRARALHDGARKPRRRGVGARRRRGRAAVREPLLPPPVRHPPRRPSRTVRRRLRPRAGLVRLDRHGRCVRRPARRRADEQRRRCAGGVRREHPEMVRGAPPVHPVGRRPPRADADRDRHHDPQEGAGARASAGREAAVHEPIDDDGRNGVVDCSRTEPAARGDQQLLLGHARARQERARHAGDAAARARKDRAAGAARGDDRQAHPRIREAQRAEAPAGARRGHRCGRGRARRNRGPQAQDPDRHGNPRKNAYYLCRPRADRAGAREPDEERGRSDGRREAGVGGRRDPRRRRHRRGLRRHPRDRPGSGRRRSDRRTPVRTVLQHQVRRHGHGAEHLPFDHRIASGAPVGGQQRRAGRPHFRRDVPLQPAHWGTR